MAFESTYADQLDALVLPWQGADAPDPKLLVFNEALAAEFGLEDLGLDVLSGRAAPVGSTPVAMAYSGHQFGNYAPLLGDGRALLVGEIPVGDTSFDVHLKGSGPTPFSRGGDGFAAVGPMLREYLISEAMHALGIPTTRSLSVVATGRDVQRVGSEPGAVLTRIASSHIRVGTFEFAVRRDGLVQPLADYAIARHYPHAEGDYLTFFEAVVDAQASLVAKWMLTGFVHGVMNTDNTTISGQTIDYGPCAFLDAYDVHAVFSSIDHGGRYAFGNQPGVLKWNLARFGETLLRLVSDTPDDAIAQVRAVLDSFDSRYDAYFQAGMASKLGLSTPDKPLIDAFLAHAEGLDWTGTFRALADTLRSGGQVDALSEWIPRWHAAVGDNRALVADAMDRVNPVYIPRNHLVDAALGAATAGEITPFTTLLDVVTHPFEAREEWDEYASPAPADFANGFQTFCGT